MLQQRFKAFAKCNKCLKNLSIQFGYINFAELIEKSYLTIISNKA